MFRLIKWACSFALLVGFAWFGTTVPLGNRTLFGHLRNIAGSHETTELVEGTKSAAKPLVKKLEAEWASRKAESAKLGETHSK